MMFVACETSSSYLGVLSAANSRRFLLLLSVLFSWSVYLSRWKSPADSEQQARWRVKDTRVLHFCWRCQTFVKLVPISRWVEWKRTSVEVAIARGTKRIVQNHRFPNICKTGASANSYVWGTNIFWISVFRTMRFVVCWRWIFRVEQPGARSILGWQIAQPRHCLVFTLVQL